MQDNNKSKVGLKRSSYGLTASACLIFFLIIFSLLFSLKSQAQDSLDYSLSSETNQCVALRQGQSCYKKINLQWQANEPNDYCIVELGSNKIIQCWQQQTQGSTKTEFEADSDTTYVLRRQNNTENLASTEIKISWVYKPKPEKSSGWRLF